MMAGTMAQAIRGYIQRELMIGDPRELRDDSPLLEWGVIESLKMVALLGFLEREVGLIIPEREHSPENFENVAALVRMVERLQAEQPR